MRRGSVFALCSATTFAELVEVCLAFLPTFCAMKKVGRANRKVGLK